MALINVAVQEIHCKIVYYGPGFGKIANIEYIESAILGYPRGDLLSIETESRRIHSFDLSLGIGFDQIHGFQVRYHLYVPYIPVIYERTRVALINGADGVVFDLNSTLKVPSFMAVAHKGVGVFDTLKAISKMVVEKL
jgi:hypothetical protein